MKLKQKQRIILLFLTGYILLGAGLLMFTSLGIAELGLYAWTLKGVHIGKIIIVFPVMIGVYRIFQNFESTDAKIIIAIGILLLILPAVQSIRYKYQPISVQNYMIIILLLFGGMGIVLRAIYLRNKDRHLFDDE